jgi:hypothetical protein
VGVESSSKSTFSLCETIKNKVSCKIAFQLVRSDKVIRTDRPKGIPFNINSNKETNLFVRSEAKIRIVYES